MPFHIGGDRVHSSYACGDQDEGAFWRQFTLNLLIRQNWSDFAPRVQAVFRELERLWISQAPEVDRLVFEVSGGTKGAASRVLGDASEQAAAEAIRACTELIAELRLKLAEDMMQETLDEPLESLGV